MKTIPTICALIGMTAASLAQTVPPPPSSPEPPVATRDAANEPAQPSGASAEQARSRFEEMGYSNVEELELGQDGIWRATAEKDGTTIALELDQQGNATESAP